MGLIRSQLKSFHNKFMFEVQIAGVTNASFQECSEVSLEVARIDHWEGGSLIPQKSPGRVNVADVTLSRGVVTDNFDLYIWMQQTVFMSSMVIEPAHARNLDIVQMDRRGVTLRRWTLFNAWPTKWVGGSWDNKADEKVIESVTLAYSYAVLSQVGPGV